MVTTFRGKNLFDAVFASKDIYPCWVWGYQTYTRIEPRFPVGDGSYCVIRLPISALEGVSLRHPNYSPLKQSTKSLLFRGYCYIDIEIKLIGSSGVYRRQWTPGVDHRKTLSDIIDDRHSYTRGTINKSLGRSFDSNRGSDSVVRIAARSVVATVILHPSHDFMFVISIVNMAYLCITLFPIQRLIGRTRDIFLVSHLYLPPLLEVMRIGIS